MYPTLEFASEIFKLFILMRSPMSSLDIFRTVEELKSTVSEVLEDLVHDDTSHLSKLDKVWEQVVKPIIIKELGNFWQKAAKLGRTLEEAARYDKPSCFVSLFRFKEHFWLR